MSLKFNPFTAQFDLTGSGGGSSYIDGVVADSSLLPVTLGTPPLDAVYLAKAGSGVWLIARKPAGLYVRVANNGVAADWTYLGAFPEVNADGNWELYNTADPTKELKFDLTSISPSTTRTLTVPNASGVIDIAATRTNVSYSTNQSLPATRNSLLVVNNSNVAGINLDLPTTDTNDGDTYTFIGGTVSGPVSIRRQILTTPVVFLELARLTATEQCHAVRATGNGTNNWELVSANWARPSAIGSTVPNSGFFTTLNATGTTELVNGASAAGPFLMYRSYTNVSNYERGFMRWSSNVLQIGTEKGGTGTARALELQTDSVTRMTIGTTGNVSVGTSSATYRLNVSASANTSYVGLLENTGSGASWRGGLMMLFPNVTSGGTGAIFFGGKSITTRNGFGINYNHVNDGSVENFVSFNFIGADNLLNIIANGLVSIGGTTNAFPALKRSSTTLQVRLADDSAFAPLAAGLITATGNLVLTDNTGAETATFDAQSKLTANRTYDLPDSSGTIALLDLKGAPIELIIACSDESTNLTTGTAKVTFRAPYAFTLTAVRSSVNTAPTGSTLIVDINEAGSTVLSTKLSIDASEKTSTTAASAAVISDSAIADDAEITIDIDQIGSTIAGKGLKVTLIGTRA